MLQEFVAIDFETANSSRGSACEVGLARFVDGKLTDTFTTYIYQEWFDLFNTAIHGITADDVKNSPEFDSVWCDMKAFIGENPLMAHNAGFDMSVLYRSLSSIEMIDKDYEYYCTMIMARKVLDLAYNSLDFVADELGISYPMNHRALEDAIAAGKVAVALMNELSAETFQSAYEMLGKPKRTLLGLAKGITPGVIHSRRGASIYDTLSQQVDALLYENENLKDKVVVFTGAMSGLTRDQASLLVTKLGAKASDSLSTKTNILVCGYQDLRKVDGGKSTKLKKAEELKALGKDIEIIDEKTFMDLLV